MKMNAQTLRWSRHYQTALRRLLEQGPAASLRPALRLGRQAVALGLETLDVAQSHEQALAALQSPDGPLLTRRSPATRRAKQFFEEAISPIEKTHPAALKDDVRVSQLKQTLRRRTVESSASSRHLEQSVTRREAAEAALKKSGEDRAKLLQEATRLQSSLRTQTRAILVAQENQRHKTSLHLQDEIAQTLVAINIGLLAMKTSAKTNIVKLEKEVANMQRLVRASLKRLNRYSYEFILQHKAK